MKSSACCVDSSTFRNKLNSKDCSVLLNGPYNDFINDLDAHAKIRDNKKQALMQKRENNLNKYNTEYKYAEDSAMLPWNLLGQPDCDIIVDCYVKPQKKIVCDKTIVCSSPWSTNSEPHKAEQESRNTLLSSKITNDNIIKGKLRGMFCRDLVKRLPKDFKMSDVFPHLPSNIAEQSEKTKSILNDIYKTTTQLAYENIPFEKDKTKTKLYPMNTLERSADPLILFSYRKSSLAPTATWQPEHLPADVYDAQLLRQDFSKGFRPINFCAETERAHQISSYSGCIAPKETWMDISDRNKPFEPLTLVRRGQIQPKLPDICTDSLYAKEKQEKEEMKKDIANKFAEQEAKRKAEPYKELPGVYKAVIGSGVPENWVPPSITSSSSINTVIDCPMLSKTKKTLWEKSTNLPKPECYCKNVTFSLPE